MIKKLAMGMVSLGLVASAYSANLASDNASDSIYNGGGNFNTLNGGSGFGAWTVKANSVGNNTAFIGSSALNGGGSSGNIDTTGSKSWAFFTNNNNTEDATRSFTGGALAVGQTFKISLDTGFLTTGTGAAQGFGLQNATGTNGFEFFFLEGGTNSYTVSATGVSPSSSTAHGFTADGLTAAFTLTSSTTFSLALTYNTGSPTTETFTGSLENAVTSLTQFRIFDFGGNTTGNTDTNNAYFNSVAVVPEPATVLLVGPTILAGMFFIRRRRA